MFFFPRCFCTLLVMNFELPGPRSVGCVQRISRLQLDDPRNVSHGVLQPINWLLWYRYMIAIFSGNILQFYVYICLFCNFDSLYLGSGSPFYSSGLGWFVASIAQPGPERWWGRGWSPMAWVMMGYPHFLRPQIGCRWTMMNMPT